MSAFTVGYGSDGDGLRQSRTIGTTSKNFLWATAGALPLLLDDGGHTYVYGPSSAPIEQVASGTSTPEFLHPDLLGSTRLITDDTGAVTGTTRYDEYGVRTDHTGTADSLIGYTGNWTDPDTGFVYLRARDYDPATAQFLSVDPAVDSTRQPYAYVGNNPLQFTDPTGLDFLSDLQGNALAFGAGLLDGITFGGSSAILSAVLPGYDCFVSQHQGFFDVGSVVGTVASSVAITVLTAGAGAGLAVAGIAARVAVKEAARLAIAAARKLVTTGIERAATSLGARSGARVAESIASTGVKDAAKTCLNSFTADTPVTMADGSEKPISEVKVGDKVLATDPETGETKSKPVSALIQHSGMHTMVDLTFSDGSTLHATDHHDFWDATAGTFVDAIDLHVGDRVLSTGGRQLTITITNTHQESLTAYNLQIDDIHTYYAGTTPVLVHNSCSPDVKVNGTTFTFGDRVTARAAEEPGPMHNFPTSFNRTILGEGTQTIKSEGYAEYSLQGAINGRAGEYQIGGWMNSAGDFFYVTHRFFQVFG